MLSDKVKAGIFYGFAGFWIAWGLIDYFFDYGLQVYLSILILGLMAWIGVAYWKNMNVVMPSGSIRTDGVKIP